MSDLVQAYWWVFLIVLLVGLAACYWALARPRTDKSQTPRARNDGMASERGAGGPVKAATAADAACSTAASAPSDARVGAPDSADKFVSADGIETIAGDGAGKPKIAAAVGDPDNLLQIKGIGPKLNALCRSLGVTRYDQIAAWGPADIAEVDLYLGSFRGRIERDGWVEQARLLAAGNVTAFETKFGKLGSENK